MIKILLIDDDSATNYYNSYILKKNIAECEVIAMENGLKALNYLKDEGIPDIIFLDINMPVMNGVEFLDEATKWAQGKLDNVLLFIMMSVDIPDETLKKLQQIRKFDIIRNKVLTILDIQNIWSTA